MYPIQALMMDVTMLFLHSLQVRTKESVLNSIGFSTVTHPTPLYYQCANHGITSEVVPNIQTIWVIKSILYSQVLLEVFL